MPSIINRIVEDMDDDASGGNDVPVDDQGSLLDVDTPVTKSASATTSAEEPRSGASPTKVSG